MANAGGYDGVGTSGSIVENDDRSPVRVPSIIVADIDLDKLNMRGEVFSGSRAPAMTLAFRFEDLKH